LVKVFAREKLFKGSDAKSFYMERLLLEGSNEKSLLDGLNTEKALDLLEATDDTLVKKRKNEPRSHGGSSSIVNSAKVKGELAEYAYPMSDEDKLRVVRRFAGDWEPDFYHEVYRGDVEISDVDDVPVHPWTKLKQVREREGGAKNLSLDERYALRYVKTFYVQQWRDLL